MEEVISEKAILFSLAHAASEKKAFDLTLLDMTNLVSYTDAFLICTANNPRHVRALASELRKVGKERWGLKPNGIEGLEAARWVLVDFGDVVIHIFDGPMRGFYDLDSLWSDATRISFSPEPEPDPETETETETETAQATIGT